MDRRQTNSGMDGALETPRIIVAQRCCKGLIVNSITRRCQGVKTTITSMLPTVTIPSRIPAECHPTSEFVRKERMAVDCIRHRNLEHVSPFESIVSSDQDEVIVEGGHGNPKQGTDPPRVFKQTPREGIRSVEEKNTRHRTKCKTNVLTYSSLRQRSTA